MQLNRDKIKPDLFGEPDIKCPFWNDVAKRVIMLLDAIPPFDYESASDFQQKLIVEYWHHYDGLESAFKQYQNIKQWVVFRSWFIQSATAPEKIRRASQWLIEHGYVTLRPKAREKALETAEKARQAIGSYNEGNG